MGLKINVEGHGEYDLDLDLDSLTLRESVRLEEQLGPDLTDQMMKTGDLPQRPSVIQALIFVKLKSELPDIDVDDFDFDLGALADLDTGKDEAASSGE